MKNLPSRELSPWCSPIVTHCCQSQQSDRVAPTLEITSQAKHFGIHMLRARCDFPWLETASLHNCDHLR